MKKLIALLLAVVMALSVCACAETDNSDSLTESTIDAKNTAEESVPDGSDKSVLAENAIVETPKHIYSEVMDNQARAMQNTYLFKCNVGTITDSYFETSNIRICLPLDELAQLNKGEEIAILGKITEVAEEKYSDGLYASSTTMIIFGEAQIFDGEVPDVALREDEVFTGIVVDNWAAENKLIMKISGIEKQIPVYFADGERITGDDLADGDVITFTGDFYGIVGQPADSYRNAKLIDYDYNFDNCEMLTADNLSDFFNSENTTRNFSVTACNVNVCDNYLLVYEFKNADGAIESPWLDSADAETKYKHFYIYLPEEELATIQNGDDVEIMGVFSTNNVSEETIGRVTRVIIAEVVDQ